MFIKVSLNLDIQSQYMDILRDFLDSEHKALQWGQLYDVYKLEQGIHGILKNIRERRAELSEQLAGATVKEFAAEMPDHVGNMLRRKMERLSRLEADCLERANRNADLSLILAGQKMGVPEHYTMFPGGDLPVAERVQ